MEGSVLTPFLERVFFFFLRGSDRETLAKRLEPMIQMNVLPEIRQASGQDKRRNPENDGHYD